MNKGVLLGLVLLPLVSAQEAAAQEVWLRLMETTDIHTHIVNYDYYQDAETDAFGLAKTATLIKAARDEVPNSLLFDNGDLIQGNPLGDYKAKIDVLENGETHPVYQAMNLLDYDAANIGNHEFNYGLDFLNLTLAGADFPYINANVYADDGDDNAKNDEHYFEPYVILEREVTDEAGNTQPLKIGVIGFVPPQIMIWDKSNLEGEVIAKDIVETARRYVPEMREAGADLVVAIPHSGFEAGERQGMDENAVAYLSEVQGIDAILFGHAHSVFPSEQFEGYPGADLEKGTIGGVPSVMPGFWGDHLGVIDLTLTQENGAWRVTDSSAEARPIFDAENETALVDADPEIINAVSEAHEGTLAYIRSEVAETEAPITSYFAQVMDDPSVQIVNQAQTWYTERAVQGTEYEGLPILSAAAPFKAGGRGGAEYYTNIPAGTLAIKNVADLYIYPNTLKVVKLTGAQVKEWLERSAGQFNQITEGNPNQPLLNEDFRSYNYDVIDGVTYQIDLSQPSKYDADGNVVNENAERIVNLEYNGEPVADDQEFLVATNNYRASGGGAFPGLDGSNIVIDSPDENRQILIDYLTETETVNPSADGNWSFTDLPGEVTATFESAAAAQEALPEDAPVTFAGPSGEGFGTYQITF
jgi:2',3'-cyclic-nucleotide 2'-phosphodiesterase/3'-nucleotidase